MVEFLKRMLAVVADAVFDGIQQAIVRAVERAVERALEVIERYLVPATA